MWICGFLKFIVIETNVCNFWEYKPAEMGKWPQKKGMEALPDLLRLDNSLNNARKKNRCHRKLCEQAHKKTDCREEHGHHPWESRTGSYLAELCCTRAHPILKYSSIYTGVHSHKSAAPNGLNSDTNIPSPIWAKHVLKKKREREKHHQCKCALPDWSTSPLLWALEIIYQD